MMGAGEPRKKRQIKRRAALANGWDGALFVCAYCYVNGDDPRQGEFADPNEAALKTGDPTTLVDFGGNSDA